MADQLHVQVSVYDGDSWVELGEYLRDITVEVGDISNVGSGDGGADGVVPTIRATLINDGLVSDSTWTPYPENNEDIFQPNNPIILETVYTEPGSTPPEDYNEWDLVFEGFLGDEIKIDGQTIELSCRSKAGRLQDYYIDNVQVFPLQEDWDHKDYYIEPTMITVDGETYPMYPAHLVLQQVIEFYKDEGELIWDEDDIHTPDIPEDESEWDLEDPEDENYIPAIAHIEDDPWGAEYQSIWDVLQEIAQPFGWFIGDLILDNEYKLTFMEPPRDKDTPDRTLSWTEDIKIESRSTSFKDIRNQVTVVYGDPPEDDDEKRARVVEKDQDSIDKYGFKAMMVEEGDTWFINTESDARMFAKAMLNDLKEMTATHNLTIFFSPKIKLFDLIEVENPLIKNSNFEIAVESLQHSLKFGENITVETTITGTSRVVGGHRKWLSIEAREGVKSPISESEVSTNRPLLKPQNLEVEGGRSSLAISFTKPRTRRWSTSEFYISENSPVTPSEENLKLISRTSDAEIFKDLEVGEEYYVAVRHIDDSGNRSELVEYDEAVTVPSTDDPDAPPQKVEWDKIYWGSDFIKLTWHPVPDEGYDEYEVRLDDDFGSPY